jgi:ATP/maltotriose-dependent transcriptional regulator MalT
VISPSAAPIRPVAWLKLPGTTSTTPTTTSGTSDGRTHITPVEAETDGSTASSRTIECTRLRKPAADFGNRHLARLQRAFEAPHATADPRPGAAAAVPGLVKPLTSRELEVLGMLASGRSNQAIARELVVTVDTVKKHVSHLRAKLGAANRTEAVARARGLSLIP